MKYHGLSLVAHFDTLSTRCIPGQATFTFGRQMSSVTSSHLNQDDPSAPLPLDRNRYDHVHMITVQSFLGSLQLR